ncbi:oligosaccharide flippase family protein [Roseovarius sp. E0-M6]|uniref:oligosaccharide flippase family protein n=1 Tax=Roseovarius sp. E0-M6 TaxID=3127118 RepID=UPI003010254A
MRLRQKLRGGTFSAMILTGGAAGVAQLFVLATTPIATRLFDGEAFGTLGLFMAFSNILTIGVHFGLIDTILAAKDDDEAETLLLAVFLSIAVMSVPVGATMFALIALDLFGAGALPIWTAPATALQAACVAAVMAQQMAAIRRRTYRTLAGSHLALGLSRGGGQIGFGFLGLGSIGLVMSELGSRLVTALVLWHLSPPLPKLDRKALRRAASTALGWRRFMVFRTPATLLGVLKVSFPPLLIGAFFMVDQVGYFTLTTAVLFAPIGLLQKAIGDVFTGNYSAARRSDPREATRILWRTAAGLGGLGFLMAAALYWSGPELFSVVFGAPWRSSGEIASILAPAFWAMVLAAPLSPVLNVLRRPDLLMWFNAAAVVVFIFLYWATGFWRLDFKATVGGISTIILVSNLGLFGLVTLADRFIHERMD